LWSFNDSSEEAVEIKDDTIEPPSEAAQRARAEAKAKAEAETETEGQSGESAGEGVKAIPEDDSWMNEPVGLPDADGKARKRKNKKK
jgi:hypothetical protein